MFVEHVKLVDCAWTFEETKAFEVLLAQHFNDADRWVKIAASLPQKGVSELQSYFRSLKEDLENISAGVAYEAKPSPQPIKRTLSTKAKASTEGKAPGTGLDGRKGVSWTEEEHRLFLMGLAQFGKGNWRSIANEAVITRTPTQVASHAQKYFLRLALTKDKREKRRASIHDMTTESEAMAEGATKCCGAGGGFRAPLRKVQRMAASWALERDKSWDVESS